MSQKALTVLVGNPRPASRTRSVAEKLAAEIGDVLKINVSARGVVDLADLEPSAVGQPTPGVPQAIEDVTTAKVLVVATPVYKASFTGLLKVFLDQLSPEALSGVTAVPLTVSAAATHRDLAAAALRPVLGELGAQLPVPSVALQESQLSEVDSIVRHWVRLHAPTIANATVEVPA